MTWYGYFKAHGQRPRSWFQLVTPTYWRKLQQERTALVRHFHSKIPCGDCIVTRFDAPDGTVLRQDMLILVGRHALPKLEFH